VNNSGQTKIIEVRKQQIKASGIYRKNNDSAGNNFTNPAESI